MKIKKNLLLIVLIALLAFEFQSCKNEAPVQTGQPNPPTIPTGPALVSPVNESIVLEFNIPFTWQSFASASSYRFMISQDANFATGPLADTSGLTTTSYTTHNVAFATGIYYYWRVIASTPSGNSPWSVVWRYRIVLPPPPAPILSSPDSGAINQAYAPLFTWNAAPTADFYRIQVSASSNFSPVLFDSIRIYTTQLQLPGLYLTSNSHYFWRVNASNSQGLSNGPWSTTWNFTTINGPEANTIKGTITFVDTNFVFNFGFYVASAYTSWPPPVQPVSEDSVNIVKVGNVYQATYRLPRLANGNYVVAMNISNYISPVNIIEGIYGCDTVHLNYSQCPINPTRVTITNNFGVDNINFLSWADTTYKIY